MTEPIVEEIEDEQPKVVQIFRDATPEQVMMAGIILGIIAGMIVGALL